MKNSAKVEYVRKSVQTRSHTCHWPGCTKQVPPAMWGCRDHWYRLPVKLRTAIWNAYKIGQEKTMRPSEEYVKIARRTQRWITENTLLQTKPMRIPRWSYSAWGLMKRCPRAFKLKQIDKLREAGNAAMERGTMLHSLAEHYLIGDITGGVPPQLKKIKRELINLKKARPIVEQFWGVDDQWNPVKYGWLVAKTDAAVAPTKRIPVLIVVDHKSGNEYPDHVDQASLYAAVGFAQYPEVDSVEVEFFYIDKGYATSYEFTRAKLKHAIQHWLGIGRELMATKKFPATPSENGCKWCGFRSDKKLADGTQGPCGEWRAIRNLR